MRRKDREITDFDEMMKIIAKCDTCRLALFDDEFPYIVPLNFGTNVEEGQLYLYFHSAKEGTKLDLIRKNNKVTFEMDCEHNIIMYDERMSCTMGYESVIGHGIVEFVEDENKINALKILMRHYHEEDFKFNEKAILRTDSKTQKEVITGYVQNGIYTINEGRDLLDLPFVDGGDVNMVNGTYQPITHIGAAYGINTQGGEGDGD